MKKYLLLSATLLTNTAFAVGITPPPGDFIFNYTSQHDYQTQYTKVNGGIYKKIQSNISPRWKNAEVLKAWSNGYKGQNITVHNFDYHLKDYKKTDFNNANNVRKNDGKVYNLVNTHGDYTLAITQAIAPMVKQIGYDVNMYRPGYGYTLHSGLNIFNISLMSSTQSVPLRYLSLNDKAVVVISAGNDNHNMGDIIKGGQYKEMEGKYNLLANNLKLGNSVIYAGALDRNGSTTNKAIKASYSNKAGEDYFFQKKFLMVGVEGYKAGFSGTSMAAPIISGYAAIVGSKFNTATPNQVTNQLLNTARTDTILNYDPKIHGRGEASLTRALAPFKLR
jgi:subtilisin family serine protease